jgi:hypothetical protein
VIYVGARGREFMALTNDTVMTFQRLIEKWNHSARRAFCDAEREQNMMGKRLIEHGAMCYFNCANDLTEALASFLPHPSAIAKEDQR